LEFIKDTHWQKAGPNWNYSPETECKKNIQSKSDLSIDLAKMTTMVKITYLKGHIEGNGRGVLIFCSIQVLKMGSFEKLREKILSHWYKKHDQQWEKDPSYRYPC
jgi:hypothetical protein